MNDLSRSILKYLSQDIDDLYDINKDNYLTQLIQAYHCPSSAYGCYWDWAGRWHYLSLRTLFNWHLVKSAIHENIAPDIYTVLIPSNWMSEIVCIGESRHSQLVAPYLKIHTKLTQSCTHYQYEGELLIEIISASRFDESLIDNIAHRIIYLLKSFIHEPNLGIMQCIFGKVSINANYDRISLQYPIHNILFLENIH